MTSDLVTTDGVLIPLASFEVTRTGLVLRDVPSWDEWAAMGLQLQGLARSIHWLAGDWLTTGEECFGETYVQAVETTGYATQTLMNDKYVCSRIEYDRRRETLSFAHHAEVAKFPPEIQDYWLNRAEEEGWSREELRKAIKEANKEPVEAQPKRVSLTWEQATDLAASIEVALDRAPELERWLRILDALLEEEQ
jgi:hypothetical protein